ncbi:MAG: hypothetical protein WC889_07160, partial [Myxococcota bacterium]
MENHTGFEGQPVEIRDWDELCLMYDEEAGREGVPDTVRSAILNAASSVDWAQQGGFEVKSALNRLGNFIPDDAGALKALVVLFEKTGDHEGCEGVADRLVMIGKPAETTCPAEATATDAAPVEVAGEPAASAAVDVVEEAAPSAREETAPAVEPEAVSAAEESAEAVEEIGEDVIVESIPHTAHGEGAEGRIHSLDASLSAETDPARRAATLREMAEIYQNSMNDPHMAFMTWCRVCREDYTDLEAIDMAAGSAAATESWEELLSVFEDAIDTVGKRPEAIGLRLRTARLLSEKLDEKDQAAQQIRSVLEADPNNLEALQWQASALEAAGDWAALAAILWRKAGAVEDSGLKVEILLRAGFLYERELDDAEKAIQSFRKALEADGNNAGVLSALAVVLGRESRHEELLEVLKTQASLASGADRVSILLKMASTLDQKLGKAAEAASCYREVLELETLNTAAVAALEEIYTRTEDWKALLGLVDARVAAATEAAGLAALHRKAAQLCEEMLGDAAGAVGHLEELIAASPGDEAALEALDRLYQAAGNWDGVVDVRRRKLERSDNAAQKVAFLNGIAAIYRDRLGDPDRAARVYLETLELDNQNLEAATALSDLREAQGDWVGVLEMMKLQAQIKGTTPDAIGLWYRMAIINRDNLLNPASARECFSSALSINPAHLPS